jgi:predicted dehydrogenase
MNLQKKSVLIIGAGVMAEEYIKALSELKIKNVTILGNSIKKTQNLAKKYGYSCLFNGYKKNLLKIDKKDLVIISLPIPLIVDAAELCLKSGQENLLLEKPGSLFIKPLQNLNKQIKNQNVRIGYNRLFYSSLEKLKTHVIKDGGINSCSFTITEWIEKINFKKYSKHVLERWGIANSIHVLSMVFNLIGFPKNISCYQNGKLSWHNSGSIFVGSGISNQKIPFSYFADWNSSGRWGINIITKKNSYRLEPLEELYMFSKRLSNWKKIPLKKSNKLIKEGLTEEIISMFELQKRPTSKLFTINDAVKIIKISEKIFGY